MELTDLKSGIFGFKKEDVCEYISELNNVCSQKIENAKNESQDILKELSEKNEKLNIEILNAQTEIDNLKREIEKRDEAILTLKKEASRLKSLADERKQGETAVSDILLEAKQFAFSLREKAKAENEALKAENRKAYEQESKKLQEYSEKINAVKDAIAEILGSTQNKLIDIESEISSLKSSW